MAPTASTPSTSTLPVASTDEIRARFPALRRQIGGRPVAHFDGPGGTQVPAEVADAVREYLLEHNANSGWHYHTSRETDAIVGEARRAVADLFGARPGEIVFGANMTTLTQQVSRALGRTMGPGDRVVVTELDHHANVDPWKALERERGCEVRMVRMDPTRGALDMEDLEAALTSRTGVVAVGAASNALGTVNDIAAVAERAHAVGALVYVDAVHYAPHRLVDVHALGADFLAASAYKFYGPHVGVLWIAEGHLNALDVPRVISTPPRGPGRLESGTQSFEGMAGTRAAVDFLASLAGDAGPATGAADADRKDRASDGASRRERLAATYAALHRRHDILFRRLWDGLGAIPGVRRFGPPPGELRTATACFDVAGWGGAEAADALSGRGLFVTHGDFYAPSLVRRVAGTDPRLLRAGCAAYTTEDEVDRLVEAVAELAQESG